MYIYIYLCIYIYRYVYIRTYVGIISGPGAEGLKTNGFGNGISREPGLVRCSYGLTLKPIYTCHYFGSPNFLHFQNFEF